MPKTKNKPKSTLSESGIAKHKVRDLNHVAEFLGVSRSTVQRDIKSGKLGHVKLGRRTGVTDEMIEQFITERTTLAGEAERVANRMLSR